MANYYQNLNYSFDEWIPVHWSGWGAEDNVKLNEFSNLTPDTKIFLKGVVTQDGIDSWEMPIAQYGSVSFRKGEMHRGSFSLGNLGISRGYGDFLGEVFVTKTEPPTERTISIPTTPTLFSNEETPVAVEETSIPSDITKDNSPMILIAGLIAGVYLLR